MNTANMPNVGNTPEQLRAIRESEIIELTKTINAAKDALKKKPTPKQKQYFRNLVKESLARIQVLEVKIGKLPVIIPKGPRLELLQVKRRRVR